MAEIFVVDSAWSSVSCIRVDNHVCNIRLPVAVRRSYMEAMLICFRGGAFSAILVLVMCVGGVSILYGTLYLLFERGDPNGVTPANIPLLMVCHSSQCCV